MIIIIEGGSARVKLNDGGNWAVRSFGFGWFIGLIISLVLNTVCNNK